MRNSATLALTLGLSVTSFSANALYIDFIDLIQKNPGGYGESAWTELKLSFPETDITITASATDDDDTQQFVYLDWGNAGVGVCKDLSSGASVNTKNPGSRSNLCNPSSDDNVTTNESLHIMSTKAINLDLWFNNNHDGGFGTDDLVTIVGFGDVDVSSVPGTGRARAGDLNSVGPYFLAAGETLSINFKNEQFYLSGGLLNSVPEPGSLALLGAGIVGFAAARRRKRSNTG